MYLIASSKSSKKTWETLQNHCLADTEYVKALVSLLKAGSTRSGCSGPHSFRSWISPRMEVPQPFWVTCSWVHITLTVKNKGKKTKKQKKNLPFTQNFLIHVRSLFCCHWIPLQKVCLSLLYFPCPIGITWINTISSTSLFLTLINPSSPFFSLCERYSKNLTSLIKIKIYLRGPSLDLLQRASESLIQRSPPVGSLCCKGPSLLLVFTLSTRISTSFSAKLFSSLAMFSTHRLINSTQL